MVGEWLPHTPMLVMSPTAAPAFLREIRMVDVYEIPNDPDRARAVTFEIEYLSNDALTGEQINAATEAMIEASRTRLEADGADVDALKRDASDGVEAMAWCSAVMPGLAWRERPRARARPLRSGTARRFRPSPSALRPADAA